MIGLKIGNLRAETLDSDRTSLALRGLDESN